MSPLLVYYAANHFYGLKWAVITSVVWSVAEILYFRIKRRQISSLFKYSLAITIVFGAVDLYLPTPVFIKYESAVTNVLTSIFFVLPIFNGKKTVMQEFAERRWQTKGITMDITRDHILFFNVSTAVWAGYFFAKACIYCWVANNYTLEESLIIRTVFGNVTFYSLLLANIYFGNQIRMLMAKLRAAK